MSSPMYIVDAFAKAPFSGNPAAVCILSEPASDRCLQMIAAEMNLPETAFLWSTDAADRFLLRWFTPSVEVDLCGHATLASAYVLWSKGIAAPDATLSFDTRSGELRAAQQSDGSVEIALPLKECHDFAPPLDLLVALGVDPKSTQRNNMDVLIELRSEDEVRKASPDFSALKDVKNIRGVILTALADANGQSGYDFVSRFFAPAVGIDEDPVTGSAHCALAPYWAKRLGKSRLLGNQASKRGGFVDAEIFGNSVALRGQCIMVMEGNLTIPITNELEPAHSETVDD